MPYVIVPVVTERVGSGLQRPQLSGTATIESRRGVKFEGAALAFSGSARRTAVATPVISTYGDSPTTNGAASAGPPTGTTAPSRVVYMLNV